MQRTYVTLHVHTRRETVSSVHVVVSLQYHMDPLLAVSGLNWFRWLVVCRFTSIMRRHACGPRWQRIPAGVKPAPEWTDGARYVSNLQSSIVWKWYILNTTAECSTGTIRFSIAISLAIHHHCVFRPNWVTPYVTTKEYRRPSVAYFQYIFFSIESFTQVFLFLVAPVSITYINFAFNSPSIPTFIQLFCLYILVPLHLHQLCPHQSNSERSTAAMPAVLKWALKKPATLNTMSISDHLIWEGDATTGIR